VTVWRRLVGLLMAATVGLGLATVVPSAAQAGIGVWSRVADIPDNWHCRYPPVNLADPPLTITPCVVRTPGANEFAAGIFVNNRSATTVPLPRMAVAADQVYHSAYREQGSIQCPPSNIGGRLKVACQTYPLRLNTGGWWQRAYELGAPDLCRRALPRLTVTTQRRGGGSGRRPCATGVSNGCEPLPGPEPPNRHPADAAPARPWCEFQGALGDCSRRRRLRLYSVAGARKVGRCR